MSKDLHAIEKLLGLNPPVWRKGGTETSCVVIYKGYLAEVRLNKSKRWLWRAYRLPMMRGSEAEDKGSEKYRSNAKKAAIAFIKERNGIQSY